MYIGKLSMSVRCSAYAWRDWRRGVSRGIGFDFQLIVVEKALHRAVIEKAFLVAQWMRRMSENGRNQLMSSGWWLLGGVCIWIWCHFDVIDDEESVGNVESLSYIGGECVMQMQDLCTA